jgi:hypothetical protein
MFFFKILNIYHQTIKNNIIMIFGQINPVLSMATQDTLFNPSPEFITGSYMTAVANNYSLGANQVNFRVSYGNCEFESGSVVKFNVVHQDNVVLSGSTISTWGEDDTVILDAIAAQQGTSVTTVVSGSTSSFGF